MVEKREKKRKLSSLFVRFNLEFDDEVSYCGFSADVSEEGIKIFSPMPLQTRENLDMMIDFPNADELARIEGLVRWSDGKAIEDEDGNKVFPAGIEFTAMDSQDKRVLNDWLREKE